jgi:hypothetical protein
MRPVPNQKEGQVQGQQAGRHAMQRRWQVLCRRVHSPSDVLGVRERLHAAGGGSVLQRHLQRGARRCLSFQRSRRAVLHRERLLRSAGYALHCLSLPVAAHRGGARLSTTNDRRLGSTNLSGAAKGRPGYLTLSENGRGNDDRGPSRHLRHSRSRGFGPDEGVGSPGTKLEEST